MTLRYGVHGDRIAAQTRAEQRAVEAALQRIDRNVLPVEQTRRPPGTDQPRGQGDEPEPDERGANGESPRFGGRRPDDGASRAREADTDRAPGDVCQEVGDARVSPGDDAKLEQLDGEREQEAEHQGPAWRHSCNRQRRAERRKEQHVEEKIERRVVAARDAEHALLDPRRGRRREGCGDDDGERQERQNGGRPLLWGQCHNLLHFAPAPVPGADALVIMRQWFKLGDRLPVPGAGAGIQRAKVTADSHAWAMALPGRAPRADGHPIAFP